MKGLEPSTFCMANGPPNGSEPERTPSVAIVATVKPTLVDAGCDTRWLFLGDGEHPRRVERPLRRWAKPVADRVPSRCRPHERHAPLAQRHIPSASGPIVVERSIGTAERGEADGLAIDPHAPLGRVPTPLDRRLGPPHSVADKQPRDARDFRASTPVTPRLGNVWGAEEAEKISFGLGRGALDDQHPVNAIRRLDVCGAAMHRRRGRNDHEGGQKSYGGEHNRPRHALTPITFVARASCSPPTRRVNPMSLSPEGGRELLSDFAHSTSSRRTGMPARVMLVGGRYGLCLAMQSQNSSPRLTAHPRIPARSRGARERHRAEDDAVEGAMPQALVCVSPGSRRIRASPVRNAFGGHVMGSTARLRRETSGRGSPVKSWR
jgi:hypothetical protein